MDGLCLRHEILRLVIVMACCVAPAQAQSSSLFATTPPTRKHPATGPNGQYDRLSPNLAKSSYSAVPLPEPRKFELHGLVTIIIRESIENKTSSILETDKETNYKGSITDFPNLRLSDLLELRARGSGRTNRPNLGVKFKSDFSGEGKRSRTDSFTTRLTARIIDIKPNGTLVLEARKKIREDKESILLVMTGTCRKEDIKSDNTILSTQLYDLDLRKQTEGDMRKTTEKGFLTKILDAIFNF